MKFKKILMLDFAENTLEPWYWKRIDALCEKKILLPRDSPEISKHLADTDCMLVNFLPAVNKKLIDSTPNLKYIGILATGYGRIDTAYAAAKGIPVCNIPGYATEAVAEFAFAAILGHIRDLERGKKQAGEGNYSESTFFHVYEIKDKKFGIIGLGNIGTRIAEIALGFGAKVQYWSKDRKKDYEARGVKYQGLANLIKECDFISFNLALNKETEKIINKELIQSIKPGAVVINLAPMELLDSDALKERLRKNDIIFIMDHTDELRPGNAKQLSKFKNSIMYPPIAYTTKEATVCKQEKFVGNLENFLKGRPSNKVN